MPNLLILRFSLHFFVFSCLRFFGVRGLPDFVIFKIFIFSKETFKYGVGFFFFVCLCFFLDFLMFLIIFHFLPFWLIFCLFLHFFVFFVSVIFSPKGSLGAEGGEEGFGRLLNL